MSSAAAEAAQLQQLYQLLADTRVVNAFALASFTVVVLEHIATLNFEIQYVWKSKKTWISIFYLWILHQSVDDTKHKQLGPGMSIYQIIAEEKLIQNAVAQTQILSIIVVSADIVLAARVWILYARSQIVLWSLFALLIVEIAGVYALYSRQCNQLNIFRITVGYIEVNPLTEFFHLLVILLIHILYADFNSPFLTGCYSLTVPRYFTEYSIFPLVVAFVVFSMTLYKCGSTIIALGYGRAPILTMFLRDGFIWFFIVFASCIMELVIWSRARPSLLSLIILFIGCCGARVLMNIQYILDDDYVYGPGTLSGATDSPGALPVVTIGSAPVRRPKRGASSEPCYKEAIAQGFQCPGNSKLVNASLK
uniref:DUF6533 domain-containing protein n=1 Tax=Mycena chlorophos TaxID=658473 RepID=A0ABQ0M8U4_MYCCL|nr:predicted protein [Mycena chlorophos]